MTLALSRFQGNVERAILRCACRADAPAALTRATTPRRRGRRRDRGGRPRESQLSRLSGEQASFFRRHRELPRRARVTRVPYPSQTHARVSVPSVLENLCFSLRSLFFFPRAKRRDALVVLLPNSSRGLERIVRLHIESPKFYRRLQCQM